MKYRPIYNLLLDKKLERREPSPSFFGKFILTGDFLGIK